MTEYYKCISTNTPNFTKGKIYKILDPANLEAPRNFIDNYKSRNGWCGTNYKHFTPATLEEWLDQEGEKKLDYSYLTKFFKQNNIK